jgi:rhamnulose-1-phosphate aldolase
MLNLNHKITNCISEISEIAQYLWQKGWAEKNAGNLSVNITEFADDEILSLNYSDEFKIEKPYTNLHNNFFLFSAANSRMRDLAKNPSKYLLIVKTKIDSFSYMNLEKNLQMKPTSELLTHLSVQNLMVKQGGKNKAILHSHPNELIAITHNPKYKKSEKLSELLWNMHPESIMFLTDGIGVVPYKLSGSEKLADKTLEIFERYKIVVWEKHGCLAIGENITDAFDLIDTAVKSTDIYFKCKNAGYEPEGLTEEQINELKRKYNTFSISDLGSQF